MRLARVEKDGMSWRLFGPVGEELRLPAAAGGPFEIGLLGTQRPAGVQVKPPLTLRLAELIARLDRPVLLLDTRRDGVGGSGSWAPREFASEVPEMLARAGARHPYSFLHVPDLAPSLALLGRARAESASQRKDPRPAFDPGRIAEAAALAEAGASPPPGAFLHWQPFRAAYRREIRTSPVALPAARAFVEAARVWNGLAVFLCAEPYEPGSFEDPPRVPPGLTGVAPGDVQGAQDAVACHRFFLAAELRRALAAAFPGDRVRIINLAIGREPAVTEAALSPDAR